MGDRERCEWQAGLATQRLPAFRACVLSHQVDQPDVQSRELLLSSISFAWRDQPFQRNKTTTVRHQAEICFHFPNRNHRNTGLCKPSPFHNGVECKLTPLFSGGKMIPLTILIKLQREHLLDRQDVTKKKKTLHGNNSGCSLPQF